MRAPDEDTLVGPPPDIAPAQESAPRTTWRDRLKRFGILCAVWAIPGLVGGLSLGELAGASQDMARVSLPRALAWQILAWVTWAPWTALVIWLVQRMPFRRGNRWRTVIVHVCVCAVAASTQMMWVVVLDRTFYPGGVSSPLNVHIRAAFLRLSDFEVMTYMAILTAGIALEYFRRFREGQFAAARLQGQMVEAQLLALRSQLNPHFLFNALNSVIALMDKDVPAAQRMVARIGELLRLSLGADEAEVPLARELHLVRQYLEIEQIRFGDRLAVTIDVPAELLSLEVPNLVLQPLVENAVVHGVAPRPGPGHVTVQVRRDGDDAFPPACWITALASCVTAPTSATASGSGIRVPGSRPSMEMERH